MYTTTSCIPFLSCARPHLALYAYSIRLFFALYTCIHWRLCGLVELLLLHVQEDPGSIPVLNFISVPLFKAFFSFYFVFVLFQRSHVAVCNINFFRTMKRNWVNTTGHVKEVDPGFRSERGVGSIYFYFFFFLTGRVGGGYQNTRRAHF